MPQNVSLFGLTRSVYTRIARLALEEKGVPYDLVEVEIFGEHGVPRSHFERHPFGRIPVLRHEAFTLYETSAITRYVDEAFPGPALQPSEAIARARMNQVIGILDSYAYQPMVWGLFVQRVRIPLNGGVPNEDQIKTSLVQVNTCLDVLSRILGNSPYFAGAALSLADLHAFPMLQYLSLAVEGQQALRSRPALTEWLDSIRGRPSAAKTMSSYETPN